MALARSTWRHARGILGSAGRCWPGRDASTCAQSRPADHKLVGFGKFKDLTYAEVSSAHPEYRAWVLEQAAKAQPGRTSSALIDFASYLEASAGIGQWEELPGSQTGPIDAVQLTPEQRSAAERALAGESLFLTGAAGTGKSFLLRYIIQELEQRHPEGQVAVTASTGIAAANIGGQTLHSFAGIGLGHGSPSGLLSRMSSEATQRWEQTRVLVVDEISMLHGSLFEKLEELAQRVRCSTAPFGGLQLLLCGDFLQLPPVPLQPELMRFSQPPDAPEQQNNQRHFCFQTQAWRSCGMDKGLVLLQQPVRQAADPGFAGVLNEVRLGRVSEETQKLLDSLRTEVKGPPPDDGILPTKLFCFNRSVDKENNAQLAKLDGKATVLKAVDEWVNEPESASQKQTLVDTLNKRVPKQLRLKVGAQVILIKNRSDLGLVNGSRGLVVGFRRNDPQVRFDDGQLVRVRPAMFEMRGSGGAKLQRTQVPLKLGWALTVHKAQGMTLSRAELEVDRAFEAGQTYVALSRLTGTDGLWISGRGISRSRTRADPEALRFYEEGSDAAPACDAPKP